MDVFLVEAELLREKNLFEPGEETYMVLPGIAFDINSFTEVSDDDNAPQIPSSC